MHVDTGQFAALAEQVRGLRQDLRVVEERIRQLEDDLRDALNRIHVLEDDTPQARQLQAELDATLADNAAAGYGEDYYPEEDR